MLDEALALWRGPAYGEFSEGFARAPATRLDELRRAALEDRAALLLECGAAADAVAAARELVASEPLRTRPVEVLMRALAADRRPAEALEVYRAHRAVLADELGMDPAVSVRELEARILRGDGHGAAADGARGTGPGGVRGAVAVASRRAGGAGGGPGAAPRVPRPAAAGDRGRTRGCRQDPAGPRGRPRPGGRGHPGLVGGPVDGEPGAAGRCAGGGDRDRDPAWP